MSYLIEAEELHGLPENSDIVILDATWFLPGQPGDAHDNYLTAHIGQARFFDIDKIADQNTDLPHMLPSPTEFAAQVSAMGIDNDTQVIVYDQQGIFSAPRVWWTFRVMGHDKVQVLNGGLKRWQACGYETESGRLGPIEVKNFEASLRSELVRDMSQVLGVVNGGGDQIIDARPVGRFRGEVEEPRPGLSKGHMPGAFNVPFASLIDEGGRFKPEGQLREIFACSGVNLNAPVVSSCGSGITAAVVAFALALLGHETVSVYDGSWAEWGAEDVPVVT